MTDRKKVEQEEKEELQHLDDAAKETGRVTFEAAQAAAGPWLGMSIYLGPNLRGGRLLQSTVFRDGVPDYLQSLLEELPDVASLIVSLEQIADVEQRIQKTGTAENVAYQRLAKGEVKENGI
ncbi:hypothetical protein ACFOQM_12440 [Paenibacillus sp. GCM10012307]|uniref:Uncharacterized protein n=1 Tax=Paenibacillus roseus TaxID=2798579 RepID=A0A934J3G0_9BACL|nr:hypothetical protein [Paenibacillus roseus]MBJ6362100.1 hypothetical protein [Paenibacillus roseus]